MCIILIAARPYINKIYRKVGTHWQYLARELKVDDSDINKISLSYCGDIDQQCVQMLHQCYMSKGKDFTKLKLVKALFAIGLRCIAENILDMESMPASDS